jgi:hypothetical protein
MTEPKYATQRFIEWQKRRINMIDLHFGMAINRIENFAADHQGSFTKSDLLNEIAFKGDDKTLKYLDLKFLCITFLFLKENGYLEAEHRGRGKSILYRFKKEE